MENLIPQNSTLWAALGSSVVIAIGMIYKAFRLVKGDLRDDKVNDRVEKFVESQNEKIKELDTQLKEAYERLQVLQNERYTAIEMQGDLKGEVKAMTLRVEDLKDQREQKDREILQLKEELVKMKIQNDNLLQMNGFFKINHADEHGDK